MYAPIVMAGLMIAAAAMTAVGQAQQASAAKKQAKYAANVAERNAQASEIMARDAEDRGVAEEQAQRRHTAQIAGAQRAGLGAAGVALGSGTPADVLTDTALLGELDAQTIRANASREAYGFRVQGLNYRSEADLNRHRAKSISGALPWQVGSTLLGGAAQAFGAYNQAKLLQPRTA